MSLVTVIAALFACSSSEPETSPGDGQIDASCEQQADNVLRWDCTVQAAGPVQIRWQRVAGGPELGAISIEGTEHSFTLYFLKEDTDYQFTASSADATTTGTFTTAELTGMPNIDVSGQTTMDWMLMTAACADEPTLIIVDQDADIVWYQTFEGGVGGQGGISYNWSPQGTVLAVVSETIWEIELSGEVIVQFDRGEDYDAALHHDLFKAGNGLIYAIYQDLLVNDEGDWIVDGLLVFDGEGQVADWSSAPFLDPVDDGSFEPGGPGNGDFPGAIEYTHANGVYVDDNSDAYLSLRHLDAIWKIPMYPDDPDFGLPTWQLVGTTGGQLSGDFEISASAGDVARFSGQHHANPVPEGGLALFDNLGDNSTSRGIILDLDEQSGTAEIVEVYDVGGVCHAQGGLYPLDSGNRLVTCATEQRVMEFEPGASDPVWTFDLACEGAGGSIAPRGIPVVLP